MTQKYGNDMKNRINNYLTFSFLVMVLSSCSQATPQDTTDETQLSLCQKEREAKRYKQSVDCYLPLAENNNATAQYSVGRLYEEQTELGKQSESAYWYEKAAKQGNIYAQDHLGRAYFIGKTIPKDDKKAIYWLKKAANQGNATSQTNLAVIFESTETKLRSEKQAIYWYKKAAEQNNKVALFRLGVSYHDGLGDLPQDYKQAYYWYNKSIEQGNFYGYLGLGMLYEFGEGIEQNTDKAISCYEKAAEQGIVKAQTNLGIVYLEQKNNKEKACYWLKKATDRVIANPDEMFQDDKRAPTLYEQNCK